MFRKIVIVVLSLAAVGTGAITALSPPIGADGRLHVSYYRWRVLPSSYELTVSVAGRNAELIVAHFGAQRALSKYDFFDYWPSSFRGFYCWTIDFSTAHRTWILGFPLWAPFALFAFYPALAFIRGPLRRYRRRKRGLCLRCGYNLEGNVSGACPECGEAI